MKPSRHVSADVLNVVACLTGGLAVLHRAIQIRWPLFTKPFWLDEIVHNQSLMKADSFQSLRAIISGHYQPVLEYALRKFFWFPLTGHQEAALRVPNLVYSGLTLAIVYFSAYGFLKTSLRSKKFAILGAIAMGFLCATHKIESQHAVEARHYSLVALASAIWFLVFFRFESGRRPFLLVAASFLFLNVHFFSIPFVAIAIGYELFHKIKLGRREEACFWSAALFLMAAFTLWVNFPALRESFFSPPAMLNPGQVSLQKALPRARALWWELIGFVSSPWLPGLCLIFVLGGVGLFFKDRRTGVALLLFALLFLLPAFF